MALRTGLAELLAEPLAAGSSTAIDAVVARHARAATALRAAWDALGLELVPTRSELAANTLSALRYPEAVGNEILAAIGARGVVVAGALHPALIGRSFRVGHMGHVTRTPEPLERTVEAIAEGLGRDPTAAFDAFRKCWQQPAG